MQNEKSAVLMNELNLINNHALRGFITRALDGVPDYFFEMPASTTGKYHPAYTLGNGGLVRHTKAAVKIAASLMGLEMYAHIKNGWDCIIAALIMHDTVKKGVDGSPWTSFTHPIAAAAYIEQCARRENIVNDPILWPMVTCICDLIKSHMGQWNTDRDGQELLPKPRNAGEKFVHMCDYLASRKFITVTQDDGAPLV